VHGQRLDDLGDDAALGFPRVGPGILKLFEQLLDLLVIVFQQHDGI